MKTAMDKIIVRLEGARNILNSQIYAAKNDKDYPMKMDFISLADVKKNIEYIENKLKNPKPTTHE